MSDMDRAPLIRAQVDQEVFVDTDQSGDQLEDATVATEVTSFERVGDAYVLEGAIVFEAYVRRAQNGDNESGNHSGTGLDNFDSEEAVVQHIHHRMPFYLRVPMRSQPRGLVNVASRISNWHLTIAERGWVNVQADLTIVGLNGQQGYHFQCGAQEDGALWFDAALNDETPNPQLASQFEEELMFRGTVEGNERDNDEVSEHKRDAVISDPRSETLLNTAVEMAEVVSSARGGVPPVETEDVAEPPAEFVVQESEETARQGDARAEEPSAKDQLADFDRVFGTPELIQDAATSAVAKVEAGQLAASEGSLTAGEAISSAPEWAEFEFEHQLNLGETDSPAVGKVPVDERFVPSRSFSSEGFRATNGFVNSAVQSGDFASEYEFSGGATEPVDSWSSKDPFASQQGANDDRDVDRLEGNASSQSLWSFVDFNSPERAYTLRFVVVQEEETLEHVSERVGCLKSELLRLNYLHSETVVVGQMLLAPSHVTTATK